MTKDLRENGKWLDRWLGWLGRPQPGRPILELGCGPGWDTAYLTRKGYQVIAGELAFPRLAICAQTVPTAFPVQLDLCSPLPFPDAAFPLIIASLCLHYFPWPQTEAIVADIGRCLSDGGKLVVRVNSTNDVHYGAVGFPMIGDDFYEVYGRSKRFFTAKTIHALFAPYWHIHALEEMTIHRFEKPKAVWEALLYRK